MNFRSWRGRRRIPRWWLVGLAVLLTACGGGGGSDGGASPTTPVGADFVPLAVGDTWLYRRDDGSLERSRVTGKLVIDGQALVVVTYSDLSTGQVTTAAVNKSASAVTEVPDGSDPFLAALGAVDDLHLPLRVGDSYTQVDRTLSSGFDMDGDTVAEAISVQSTVSVMAIESVTVPAGTFPGCVKVRTLVVQSGVGSSTGRRITVTTTADEWYAEDIGVVRSLAQTSVGGISESQTRELMSWRVGTRSSDSQAPQIIATSPAPGTTVGRRVVVQLDFDEAIDGAALSGGALSILNASGGVVGTGLNTITGSRLQSNLPAPLPAGTYTLVLDNSVQDLLGNRISPQRWTLTIDGTAPLLLSTLPAANSTSVPLTTAIDLHFSEAVNLDSARLAVEVSKASSPGHVQTSAIALDAFTVRLQPDAPLQPNTDYEIRFADGVSDLFGNTSSLTAAVPFRTGGGPFQLPLVPIDGFVGAAALAVGDVSGDGRADLLAAAPALRMLKVRRQLPDGSLDQPYTVALTNNACEPDSVQIADLNGDGRLDVVVAERGCGMDLLLQNAAGVLEPGPFLASLDPYLVRAADLNGDGRADLIGIGSGTDVSIWLQRSDGVWGAPTLVPLAHMGTLDLAVGDINGDGRPDIVVASGGSGPPGKGLGLLLQRADGGFDAGGYLDVDPVWGAWGLAIGDIDGDGRADIVAGFLGAGLGVFRQAANGQLQPMQVLPGFDSVCHLRLADLDGDGRQDLVAYKDGLTPLVVMMQQADGALQRAQQLENELHPALGPDRLAVGDLNGDGRPDLAIAGPSVLYATPQGVTPANITPLQRRPLRALKAVTLH